ncbi:MAG: hypothetical protein WC788_08870 [Candidatus Paceibacterota bacterium]|jgi:hypothetical protein
MDYEGYKAKMEGFAGPIYPKRIADLNKMFKNALSLDGFTLEEALRRVDGFEMAGFTGHSSGIPWKRLSVVRGEKEIIIYFPLEFKEKTSITVYSKGANEDEIENITNDIIRFIAEEAQDAEKEGKEFDKIVGNFLKQNTVGKIFGLFKKG